MEEYVEQGKAREWFGVGEITNNGSEVTSLVNGIDEDEVVKEVKTIAVEARLQNSPTLSVENEPSGLPAKRKTDPPPPRKAVLAAAGAFESMLKEAPAKASKPKVIFTQSRSLSTNRSEDKTPLDEERRLRILGLSDSENTSTNGPSDERSAR